MQFYVCDDERQMGLTISEIIKKTISESNTFVFEDGRTMLSAMEDRHRNVHYSLSFLALQPTVL